MEAILYFAILSFLYLSGFTNIWLSGGNILSYLLHVESLVQIIFGGALQSLVIWYIIVKIGDLVNYLSTRRKLANWYLGRWNECCPYAPPLMCRMNRKLMDYCP